MSGRVSVATRNCCINNLKKGLVFAHKTLTGEFLHMSFKQKIRRLGQTRSGMVSPTAKLVHHDRLVIEYAFSHPVSQGDGVAAQLLIGNPLHEYVQHHQLIRESKGLFESCVLMRIMTLSIKGDVNRI